MLNIFKLLQNKRNVLTSSPNDRASRPERGPFAPVAPEDCAFLIGLPHHSTAMRSDWRAGRSGWARFILGSEGWNASKAGSLEPVFTLLQKTCELAENLGVEVVPEATTADLKRVCIRKKVVTLFSHGELVPFSPNDIGDVDDFLHCLNSSKPGTWSGILACRFAEAVGADAAILAVHGNAQRKEAVARALNRMGAPLRPVLEEVFGEHLQPAPAIEFRDGMQTLPQTIKAIPKDWDGVLDCSICHSSSLLTNVMKHVRPECLVLGNENPANPVPRLIRYKIIIQLLKAGNRSYPEALEEIIRGCREKL